MTAQKMTTCKGEEPRDEHDVHLQATSHSLTPPGKAQKTQSKTSTVQKEMINDPKLTRTANLQEAPEKNWNLTRYHCAIGPC
jgi:hypothetical protein